MVPRISFVSLLIAFTVSGCAASSPQGSASADAPHSPLGNPFSDERYRDATRQPPLVIDRSDLTLGTTVTFERLPTSAEVYDLQRVYGLARVVIALPAWPAEYAALEALRLAPREIDMAVLLPGYPPSRGAAEVWNLLGAPVRLIVLAKGPPSNHGVIGDLNTMRNLERVIVEMDEPSRSGFERLQRPLSFRKIVHYPADIPAASALALTRPGPRSGGSMPQSDHDRRVDYVEFGATDLAAVKAFYAAAFGWKFTDYGPDYVAFADGRLNGGFTTHSKAGRSGALVVMYANDLEAVEVAVLKAGGKIEKPIFSFPGGRRFHFIDPAGNELAVWSDT